VIWYRIKRREEGSASCNERVTNRPGAAISTVEHLSALKATTRTGRSEQVTRREGAVTRIATSKRASYLLPLIYASTYTLKHENKCVDRPGVWATYDARSMGSSTAGKAAFSIRDDRLPSRPCDETVVKEVSTDPRDQTPLFNKRLQLSP
jgi:hypothetical protein